MDNKFYGNPHGPNEYTYVHGYGFTPPPPQISEKRMIRHYSNAISVAELAVFVLPSVFYPIINAMSRAVVSTFTARASSGFISARIYESNELTNIILWLISVVVPFIIYCLVIKMPFSAAAPMKKPNSKVLIPAIMVGMGMSVLGGFFAQAVGVITSLFGVSSSPAVRGIPESAFGYILMIISIVVLPAFFEEFVYRGIIMQSLRRFGDGFALLCSSIVFAIVHLNLEQGVFAFLMGLVIGYFTLRTGSLWTGIAIHFANNLLSVILDVFSMYSNHTNLMLVIYILDAVIIVLAVLAVMYLDKNDDSIFSIRESNTASLETHKMSYFFGSVGMVFLIVIIIIYAVSNMAIY